jgi:hypothetical protein
LFPAVETSIWLGFFSVGLFIAFLRRVGGPSCVAADRPKGCDCGASTAASSLMALLAGFCL